MPASNKMLKRREQAANVAAGIGDSQGRLSHKEVRVAVMAKCTQCGLEIRTTKTNTEIKAHASSKHPTSTFAICFPSIPDPEKEAADAAQKAAEEKAAKAAELLEKMSLGGVAEGESAPTDDSVATSATPVAAAPVKKPKKKDDLSLLNAAMGKK